LFSYRRHKMADKRKPTLLLDFDGTIHSYTSGWHGPTEVRDEMTPGFAQWAADACRHFDLQVYSTRSEQPGGIEAMAGWLQSQLGNFRAPGLSFGFPKQKVAAHLTIDDRAITFKGDWLAPGMMAASLLKFKPWNR
jgi:hypothetical protein